jgi:hypothetical protein
MRDIRAWMMLTSSMDLLGDTEFGIDSYLQSDDDDAHPGQVYIAVYGILQALFLQQDAIRHICESLLIDFKLDDTLRGIRNLRNDATGHPTKGDHGKTFHMIVRSGMSRLGFRMYSFDSIGVASERHISIRDLLREQEESISSALVRVIRIERSRASSARE